MWMQSDFKFSCASVETVLVPVFMESFSKELKIEKTAAGFNRG
jgi:hypothetical protein